MKAVVILGILMLAACAPPVEPVDQQPVVAEEQPVVAEPAEPAPEDRANLVTDDDVFAELEAAFESII